MGIIGTLPVQLANGTIADASQVMADLNFIANQVNANAQPAGSYLLPGFISPGSLVNIQVFTASATYTPIANATKAIIEMVGAGGAGGGAAATGSSQYSVGSGGCGGAYFKLWIPSGLQTYSGISLTVGAGGAGVSGANGNAGGNTLFGAAGAFATAVGGAGGIAGAANGLGIDLILSAVAPTPVSGSATTLAVLSATNGRVGDASMCSLNGNVIGNGGDSALGMGGHLGVGNGFGSAGSGAQVFANSGAAAGFAGANGLIIIYEFQ